MTDAELNLRLLKFRKRAPGITSQSHVEKIIGSFPPEHRKVAIDSVSGMLPERLEAKEPALMEVKPKDPENPTIQEETAIRLNAHNVKILEQSEVIQSLTRQLADVQLELKTTKELLDAKSR